MIRLVIVILFVSVPAWSAFLGTPEHVQVSNEYRWFAAVEVYDNSGNTGGAPYVVAGSSGVQFNIQIVTISDTSDMVLGSIGETPYRMQDVKIYSDGSMDSSGWCYTQHYWDDRARNWYNLVQELSGMSSSERATWVSELVSNYGVISGDDWDEYMDNYDNIHSTMQKSDFWESPGPVDSDGDGIYDNHETEYGLDPNVGTDMISCDLSDSRVTNEQPYPVGVSIDIYDANGDKVGTCERFMIAENEPFSDSPGVVLRDYGQLPDGFTIKANRYSLNPDNYDSISTGDEWLGVAIGSPVKTDDLTGDTVDGAFDWYGDYSPDDDTGVIDYSGSDTQNTDEPDEPSGGFAYVQSHQPTASSNWQDEITFGVMGSEQEPASNPESGDNIGGKPGDVAGGIKLSEGVIRDAVKAGNSEIEQRLGDIQDSLSGNETLDNWDNGGYSPEAGSALDDLTGILGDVSLSDVPSQSQMEGVTSDIDDVEDNVASWVDGWGDVLAPPDIGSINSITVNIPAIGNSPFGGYTFDISSDYAIVDVLRQIALVISFFVFLYLLVREFQRGMI